MNVISIQHLSKHFDMPIELNNLKAKDAYDALLRIIGFKKKKTDKGIQKTFAITEPALRDVSLEIEKGEALCLVGPSGSGKSVFLRILANEIPPSKGRIEIHGSVSSLISVGSYIDSRLTAIENIINYQSATRCNVNLHYLKKVISFAALEGFENMPVRTYSTGMRMRLSMAMVLQSNSSIYLIDDVMRVGDIEFQQKCFNQILQLKNSGATLILALTDDAFIEQLNCRLIYFNNGSISSKNDTDGTKTHEDFEAAVQLKTATGLPENEVIKFCSLQAKARNENDKKNYIDVTIGFIAKVNPIQIRIVIDIVQGKTVIFRSLSPDTINISEKCRSIFSLKLPIHLLNPGTYKTLIGALVIYNDNIYVLKALDAIIINLKPQQAASEKLTYISKLSLPFVWEMEKIKSDLL